MVKRVLAAGVRYSKYSLNPWSRENLGISSLQGSGF